MPDKKISEMTESLVPLADGDYLTFLDIDESVVDNINKKIRSDIAFSLLAPKDSPVFTGNPVVPTPAQFDNSTTIPNTEWVQLELSNIALLDLADVNISPFSVNDGDVVKWDDASGFWVAGQAGGTVNRETLTGDKTLTASSEQYHFLITGQTARDVILPDPPALAMRFIIKNLTPTGAFITVRESVGGTVVIILNDDTPIVEVIYDGVEWQALAY